MSDCDECAFLASAGCYAVESLTEECILRTGRCPCRLCDDCLHLLVSVNDSSAFFASALIVAKTDACP